MSLDNNTYVGARRDVKHNFFEVKEKEMNKMNRYNYKIVKGSRSFRLVGFVSHENVLLLDTREFACFCDTCIDDLRDVECHSSSYVASLNLVKMQTYSAMDGECDVETNLSAWGNDGDSYDLARELYVGDNFVVRAKAQNIDGVEVYICNASKHCI